MSLKKKKIKRDNFETRIEDLSEINNQMKEKIESISVDKDNDQKSLTGKVVRDHNIIYYIIT